MEFRRGLKVIHKRNKLLGTLVRTNIKFHEHSPTTWVVIVDDFPHQESVVWNEENIVPLEGTNRHMSKYLLKDREEVLQ